MAKKLDAKTRMKKERQKQRRQAKKNKKTRCRRTQDATVEPATTYVTPAERDLMLQWKRAGKKKSEIMQLTGRSKKTVNRQLKRTPMKVGRKKIITKKMYRKLKGNLGKLLRKKNAKKEVTVNMVKSAAKVKASARIVLDEFHRHGVYFRPLRKKPILTKDDIKARKKFADKYKGRTTQVWLRSPAAVIDNKHFPLFRDRAGRAEAARRQVRGAYRARGEGPKPWMVKANPSMKYPAKGVQVTAAVINGKIRVWRYVEGQWGAQQAVKMYKETLVKALRRNFPKQKTFTVMEDNDPAGYKSKAALAAKSTVGIKTLRLPPRSPDLNVLDYSLWHAINVAMRKQEARMRVDRRESVKAFKQRLRQVALSLPKKTVTKAVQDMRRRVQLVRRARGGLFTE